MKTAGPILRLTGLLIEMLGIWAVFQQSRGPEAARWQLPGGSSLPLAWLAVALGFILWLLGTIMVYGSRSRHRAVPPDEEKWNP
jgi:hypothetical protein